MALLLLLTSPPRTLRAVRGGSAAGPSHSRQFGLIPGMVAIGGIADIVQHWHEMARSRMTQSRHQFPVGNNCLRLSADSLQLAFLQEGRAWLRLHERPPRTALASISWQDHQ